MRLTAVVDATASNRGFTHLGIRRGCSRAQTVGQALRSDVVVAAAVGVLAAMQMMAAG
jgi:hypothetical protein